MSQEMPQTMSQITNTSCALHGKSNNAQLGSSCECDLKRKAGYCQEKKFIAQPIFVFEDRNQAFKRPAEDTVDKVEHGFSGFSRKRVRSSSFTFHTADAMQESTPSQKRMRSSSFTVLPTFPPSQPVKKNNVFMTTTALQWNVDFKRTEKGPWEPSQQYPILRPAILPPPQSQRCAEWNAFGHPKVVQFYKTNEKAKSEFSEENSHMASENSTSTQPLVKSSTGSTLLSPTPIKRQPNEDRHSLQSHSSDFIFGENMNERVLCPQKSIELHQEKDMYNKEKPFSSTLSFSFHFSCTNFCKNTTLKESAAAFFPKPSPKCILEKIEVITGEEEEHNVLKINCKLFIFKKITQSWTEKGRGMLRLNDTANNNSGMLQSRLIMRNQGNLRLILNSKLWAQMEIQRASHKNLRITATDLDDCSIKIFLIQASAKDIGCLYAAIHHRLVALRTFYKQELDVNEIETESETVIQLLSCDSCDEDDDMLKITTDRSRKPLIAFPNKTCVGSLEKLQKEFQFRFKELHLHEQDIQLFCHPFSIDVENVDTIYQMEPAELQNCDSLKDAFKLSSLHNFYASLPSETYPHLRNHVLKMATIFGSTYVCEQTFSRMKHLKSPTKSKLTDAHLHHLLQLAVTNMEADIDHLISQKQAHSSY